MTAIASIDLSATGGLNANQETFEKVAELLAHATGPFAHLRRCVASRQLHAHRHGRRARPLRAFITNDLCCLRRCGSQIEVTFPNIIASFRESVLNVRAHAL